MEVARCPARLGRSLTRGWLATALVVATLVSLADADFVQKKLTKQ